MSEIQCFRVSQRTRTKQTNKQTQVPDFLDEEYESALPPRKEDEPMSLEYALDEVRHCLHDIGRFKMWLDYN